VSADETLAAWRAACGTPSGGENLLKHAGRVYVIDVHAPERFANGALRGRVYRFGPGGLLDIGRYKIAAEGTVAACPQGLRGALPGWGALEAFDDTRVTPARIAGGGNGDA